MEFFCGTRGLESNIVTAMAHFAIVAWIWLLAKELTYAAGAAKKNQKLWEFPLWLSGNKPN